MEAAEQVAGYDSVSGPDHGPGSEPVARHIARQFYADALGFRVTFEATEDGKTGLLGLERGGISFTIDCPMAGHGREACMVLQVADADAYYEEWRARVEIRRSPRNESWAPGRST